MTLTGSAFALARWFQPERYANRPEDDFVRDEILNEIYDGVEVAAKNGVVLVRTKSGVCAIEQRPEALVVFDFVSNERWERTSFWMNASSVKNLGDALREKPRVDFDALFVGADPRETR